MALVWLLSPLSTLTAVFAALLIGRSVWRLVRRRGSASGGVGLLSWLVFGAAVVLGSSMSVQPAMPGFVSTLQFLWVIVVVAAVVVTRRARQPIHGPAEQHHWIDVKGQREVDYERQLRREDPRFFQPGWAASPQQ